MKVHPRDIGLKYPRVLKAHNIRIPKGQAESELQEMCEVYLNINGLAFLHIPDGLYKFLFGNVLSALIHKNTQWYGWLMGVRGLVSRYLLGQPDLFIFDKNRYLAVELKTKRGTVRQGQKKIHRKIPVHVIRDYDSFKKLIDEWLQAK